MIKSTKDRIRYDGEYFTIFYYPDGGNLQVLFHDANKLALDDPDKLVYVQNELEQIYQAILEFNK